MTYLYKNLFTYIKLVSLLLITTIDLIHMDLGKKTKRTQKYIQMGQTGP